MESSSKVIGIVFTFALVVALVVTTAILAFRNDTNFGCKALNQPPTVDINPLLLATKDNGSLIRVSGFIEYFSQDSTEDIRINSSRFVKFLANKVKSHDNTNLKILAECGNLTMEIWRWHEETWVHKIKLNWQLSFDGKKLNKECNLKSFSDDGKFFLTPMPNHYKCTKQTVYPCQNDSGSLVANLHLNAIEFETGRPVNSTNKQFITRACRFNHEPRDDFKFIPRQS